MRIDHHGPRLRGRRCGWRASASAALVGVLLASVACASSAQGPDGDAGGADAVLTVDDAWVKAADEGMTAVFGTLVNHTDADIAVVDATCDISPMEIHEMAMSGTGMVMQEMAGGLQIAAGGTHVLEPGGDHLMLMDLAEPVQPGDEVQITLELDDGSTVEFTAVGKPFAGAEEDYHGDHDHGDHDHGDHDHGDHDHGDEHEHGGEHG